jgi:hypothetical protein
MEVSKKLAVAICQPVYGAGRPLVGTGLATGALDFPGDGTADGAGQGAKAKRRA